MDTEVIIGSIFLGLALPLTLVVVVIILRIIVIAGAILGLAKDRILPAALGIAANTKAIANLGTTEKVAGGILSTVQAIDGVAGSIAGKLRAVASAVERRG